jgi:hypothetical protein
MPVSSYLTFPLHKSLEALPGVVTTATDRSIGYPKLGKSISIRFVLFLGVITNRMTYHRHKIPTQFVFAQRLNLKVARDFIAYGP